MLTHFVVGDDELPDEHWLDAVAEDFHGEVAVGHDLDELTLLRTVGVSASRDRQHRHIVGRYVTHDQLEPPITVDIGDGHAMRRDAGP